MNELKSKIELLISTNSPYPQVLVKEPTAVADKVLSIVSGKKEKLHVVSDFDMTMSRYWVDGKRNVSSHGVINLSSFATNDYKVKCAELYNKYYPMEISTELSLAQKVLAMEEWWAFAHVELLKLGLTKESFKEMAQQVEILWRDSLSDLVKLCHHRNIPLLVFSAGLYDVIHAILENAQLFTPNMHVISNCLAFDPQSGISKGFIGKLIHTFNKNEAVVADYAVKFNTGSRKNLILIGDSLGDLQMADGINSECKLTIGFLNHDTEKLLPSYLDAFDIVLTDDASFDFIIQILSLVE